MTKQIYTLMLLTCLVNLFAVASSLADEVIVENARKCISTRTVIRTEVVDDLNILFFTRGKTVYLNILPSWLFLPDYQKGHTRRHRGTAQTTRACTGASGSDGRDHRRG